MDLIAPGTGIFSTVFDYWLDDGVILRKIGEKSSYDYLTGTSMAAPHVSGVAAAIWSLNPNLKGDEVKRIICDTATGNYGYEDSAKYPDRYKMLNAY